MNKEFETFLIKKSKQSSEEIVPVVFDNKKYWLKKARSTKSLFSHRFFYFLTKFEILFPVENKTAKEAMEYETSKIKKFKTLGLNTPLVVFQNSDFFVLEDCGKNVNSYIRKRDITKEKMYFFIDKVILELSKIHNSKQFHGGAQARNFTFKEDKIYAIDLEDSFKDDVDLKLLQFRDFLLLLLSFTKTRANFELDFNYIIDKYITLTKNYEFKKRLKNLANKLSFFIFLSDIKFINKILGRDGKSFFKLLKILKNLES
ncbi:kinase [Halarcobacter anaerophilus]|uniref:kinase n=1 Tax=Halarcobacter anaerophilus TaxID=877500 RepID=UPI0005CAB24F|nr:kinase [Halarcobacter anaerophilus]